MSGTSNWGIRRKLFSIVVLILIGHIVLLVFMGSTLFEKFYLNNKVENLESGARKILYAYSEDPDSFYDQIQEVMNQNIHVSLYRYDGENITSIYIYPNIGNIPYRLETYPPPDIDTLPDSIKDRLKEMDRQQKKGLKERFDNTSEEFNIDMGQVPNNQDPKREPDPFHDNSISLSVKVEDGLYLYMITPKDFIKSTADQAVLYSAFLSIGILAAGSIVIYFLVGKMTRPIQEIQTVAEQISHLDFSKKCSVTSRDEIGLLAESINDMSDRLQANIQRLIQANEVLQNDLIRQQKTDRMRQQFVANVSHDFKTPLTLMISYAEALTEESLSPQGRNCCEIIINEGNQLSQMVGRLLQLSKLENGIDQLSTSIFCLDEVLDETIRAYQILAEKKQITISKNVDEPYIVSADYQKIQQVVNNLFENALKYTSEGGSVQVQAFQQGNLCKVSIVNTGEPIASEDLESLFDSFYRGDKSRSRAEGYGLGLAIVKTVMEAHHQAYSVENTPEGVCFWFQIPLADMDLEDDFQEDDIG